MQKRNVKGSNTEEFFCVVHRLLKELFSFLVANSPNILILDTSSGMCSILYTVVVFGIVAEHLQSSKFLLACYINLHFEYL
jgi:hypothetical protein